MNHPAIAVFWASSLTREIKFRTKKTTLWRTFDLSFVYICGNFIALLFRYVETHVRFTVDYTDSKAIKYDLIQPDSRERKKNARIIDHKLSITSNIKSDVTEMLMCLCREERIQEIWMICRKFEKIIAHIVDIICL